MRFAAGFRTRSPLPPRFAERASFLLLVALTGAGMGAVAVAFRELLRGMNRLFFGSVVNVLDLGNNLLDRPYVALIPAAGGLLVGLYFRHIVRRPPGHGVSEVMVALETRGSRIPWISSVHTAIASSITIGSGGSAGPEGPIIQIGAALSSGLGQFLHLPPERLRTLLACGAGAALAGMYHAPLTGAAFAAEVLLDELEPRTFSLLALAAVAASAVARAFGSGSLITLPLAAPPWQDVPIDVLLGLLAAPLGVLLILLVHGIGERTARLAGPAWLKPAAGGLLVGLIGLFLPRVLGSGETGIEQTLGGQMDLTLLLLLPFAKLLATSITLGSGATGGVFTPSLFIGAAFGGAFGMITGHIWGGASPVGSYALVGMGTVVAAAVNAPLTAVLLVCEFTRDFALLPEVVAAVAASVLLARQLQIDSIYTLPLRRHGIDRALIRHTPLARIKVAEVMTTTWPALQPERSLRQALALSRTSGKTVFPVVDGESGRYLGVLSLDAITSSMQRDDAGGGARFEDGTVGEMLLGDVPLVRPEESLHDVALTLGGSRVLLPLIPVVMRNGDRYAGVLERTAILRSYSIADRTRTRAGLLRKN